MNTQDNRDWVIWDNRVEYGQTFYRRAIGELSEMESSKASANHIAKIAVPNDIIMDVGCGAGHYLVSLDKRLKIPFSYLGIDLTSNYIELARKAFKERTQVNPLRLDTRFEVGDIFNLPFDDRTVDIVTCNNLFLHLPSIKKPLIEIWRMTRKYIIVRTLIGKKSFRIKQVNPPEEFTLDGEPIHWNYHNIYSEDYIKSLVEELDNVKECKIIEDKDYNPENIGESNCIGGKLSHGLTVIINGMQVNNYIIQPWQFLIVEKQEMNDWIKS